MNQNFTCGVVAYMKEKKAQKPIGLLPFLGQMALGVLDALLMMGLGFLIAVLAVYHWQTPNSGELMKRKIAQTSYIYDKSGDHLLYEIHGEENREVIKHDEIPATVRIATVAAEDNSFYSHLGIDPFSILRAFKVNLQNGETSQGGSTITQQLARNAFLSREKTLKRKFLEMVIAFKIERHYQKDEILDAYLNEVPYGSNAYGIEAAAQTFFGKNASGLTLDEAALIAALPKAPTYYSPYNSHANELFLRQKKILERIAELKLASPEAVKVALKSDTHSKLIPFRDAINAPHFVFYVIEELEKRYGRDFLETGGLNIYTTLDWEKQQLAEQVVKEGAQRNLARGATNAALVAVNPKDGGILAMVGSKNYFDAEIDGQVNVAISPRQPGSSFKPFAYATAFEKGYQPETLVLDAPTNFGPDGSGRPYIPRNYDGKFHGMLTMREALAQSLNVPAVKTLYLAGLDATIEMAHRLGITTLNDRPRYGLSLVLGGGEVKLLDMASAFAVFANDGERNPVQAVEKIVDHQGRSFYEKQFKPVRVLDRQIARKIDSILSDNKARTPIFGSRSPLILEDRPVAAKTGTTQEFRDAWTVGFTPSLTVGVWAGNNNNFPMKGGSDGVFVAAPIWHAFMQQALASTPVEQFIAYDKAGGKENPLIANVKKKITYIDKKSGKKVSQEKVMRMDAKKVKDRIEEKIEYIPIGEQQNIPIASAAESNEVITMALPPVSDPMFNIWSGQMGLNLKKDEN